MKQVKIMVNQVIENFEVSGLLGNVSCTRRDLPRCYTRTLSEVPLTKSTHRDYFLMVGRVPTVPVVSEGPWGDSCLESFTPTLHCLFDSVYPHWKGGSKQVHSLFLAVTVSLQVEPLEKTCVLGAVRTSDTYPFVL